MRLVSERLRFPSSRRRREPLVGRLGRRTTGGTTASRRIAARRCLAAILLRRWERYSDALMVSTVPESLSASRSRARSRWTSLRAVVVPRSRLSCTRESAVLTLWPPGPEERENCSTSSPAGTRRPRGAPGPGGTCRSSTRLLSRNSEAVPRSVPVGSSQGWMPGLAHDGVYEPEVARLRKVVELHPGRGNVVSGCEDHLCRGCENSGSATKPPAPRSSRRCSGALHLRRPPGLISAI